MVDTKTVRMLKNAKNAKKLQVKKSLHLYNKKHT